MSLKRQLSREEMKLADDETTRILVRRENAERNRPAPVGNETVDWRRLRLSEDSADRQSVVVLRIILAPFSLASRRRRRRRGRSLNNSETYEFCHS